MRRGEFRGQRNNSDVLRTSTPNSLDRLSETSAYRQDIDVFRVLGARW